MLCYLIAELCSCSSVLWKVELVGNEIGYLTEEISKQNDKGSRWFLLTAYSKMQKGNRNEEGIAKQKGTVI